MPQFVAEMTTNHLGNLNLACRMIQEAAGAGAHAVKFQKKHVSSYYTEGKLATEYPSPYGETYQDYREMFEFNHPQDWARLWWTARDQNVLPFATAQDERSLRYLCNVAQCTIKRVKVASCNAGDLDFLRLVAEVVWPATEIVLSVAGLTMGQVKAAAAVLDNQKRAVWVLHCVAEYPCRTDSLRLGNIPILVKEFKDNPRIKVGYSGHERGWLPSMAAVRLGAEMVERHFCLSRDSFAHHIECSLTPVEFRRMVQVIAEGTAPRLPPVAYRHEFGMSDRERLFLQEQTYGTDQLHRKDDAVSSTCRPQGGRPVCPCQGEVGEGSGKGSPDVGG